MAIIEKPITVWLGDIQLTGRQPRAFDGASAFRTERRTQKEMFDSVLTECPTHITPKRRVTFEYVPGRYGSEMVYDDGYADTTQTYNFALDLDKSVSEEERARKIQAFAAALTGEVLTQDGRVYQSSGARWDWLVDTYDNPFAVTPRPGVNLYSAYPANISPDVRYARLARYDGGTDLLNDFARRGRAAVTFRIKPALCEIRGRYQSASSTPTAGYYSVTYYTRNAPILKLLWGPGSLITRTDNTQPITIMFADNANFENAAYIKYDADTLTHNDCGAYGIGVDLYRREVITGPKDLLYADDPYSFGDVWGEKYLHYNTYYCKIDNGTLHRGDVPGLPGSHYFSVQWIHAEYIC